MAWAKTRKPADKALTTYQWKKIRQYWAQQLPLPCSRGDHMITSARKYYPGTKITNPRSLVVGHKVARSTARALGYSEEWINALEQTQPECWACSSRSGARMGAVLGRSTQLAAPARAQAAAQAKGNTKAKAKINTVIRQAAASARW